MHFELTMKWARWFKEHDICVGSTCVDRDGREINLASTDKPRLGLMLVWRVEVITMFCFGGRRSRETIVL